MLPAKSHYSFHNEHGRTYLGVTQPERRGTGFEIIKCAGQLAET